MQDKLVEKDFDIEAAASGVLKPVIKEYKANVTNNILEIRFIWAGKGTVAIPKAGVYGPLISAISVDPSEWFPLPSLFCKLINTIIILQSCFSNVSGHALVLRSLV